MLLVETLADCFENLITIVLWMVNPRRSSISRATAVIIVDTGRRRRVAYAAVAVVVSEILALHCRSILSWSWPWPPLHHHHHRLWHHGSCRLLHCRLSFRLSRSSSSSTSSPRRLLSPLQPCHSLFTLLTILPFL